MSELLLHLVNNKQEWLGTQVKHMLKAGGKEFEKRKQEALHARHAFKNKSNLHTYYRSQDKNKKNIE